jgi:hypothetical protein
VVDVVDILPATESWLSELGGDSLMPYSTQSFGCTVVQSFGVANACRRLSPKPIFAMFSRCKGTIRLNQIYEIFGIIYLGILVEIGFETVDDI